MMVSPIIPTIKYENITYKHTPIACVIGCLDNQLGKTICSELLQWVAPMFDTFVIHQDYPGILYEYPALQFAQVLSRTHKIPVMYIHTKGAFNENSLQWRVRQCWHDEFIGKYDLYHNFMQKQEPFVIAPFIGKPKIPWFNGYMANFSAWDGLGEIHSSTHRYAFEQLWRQSDVNTYATVLQVDSLNNSGADFMKMLEYIGSIRH